MVKLVLHLFQTVKARIHLSRKEGSSKPPVYSSGMDTVASQSTVITSHITERQSYFEFYNAGGHIEMLGREIPYSGFLSRVKTFANFAFLWRFAKVLSAKTNLDHCDMPSKLMTPCSLFFQRADSVFGPASRLSRYYRSGYPAWQGGRIPTQVGNADIRRLHSQTESTDSKTRCQTWRDSSVRCGLHSVTRSRSRSAYRSNSQTAESHSRSNER